MYIPLSSCVINHNKAIGLKNLLNNYLGLCRIQYYICNM